MRKGENPRHPSLRVRHRRRAPSSDGCRRTPGRSRGRELLFDLDTARRQMFAREGKSSEFDLVSKSLANLLRMWAED
ncbi:MAG TPA: hypothetical protein VFQ33_11095 [Xanthobacteraceae bacterium]|nr:hypothetical protein [Xanthobacteraceae bacterium]